MKDRPGTMKNHENTPGNMKNQPQLTYKMGEGGQGRNKQKRHRQTLFVTDAGKQLTV